MPLNPAAPAPGFYAKIINPSVQLRSASKGLIKKNVLLPSNVWHTVESSGWSPDVYFERNRVMVDSVLIGINFYHIVMKSKDSTGNVWSETKKYVRESDGQLWVLDTTISINEVLIMDINLHKGDEFSYIDGLGRTMKLLVTKADTIIDMSGQQPNVLYLSCAQNEAFRYRWIEGIGPDVGVFSSTFKHCVVDGNVNSLTCFYTNDVQMWQSEDFTKCWINPSVIDTTDMDRSTTWYSSSLTGNLLPDRDCELKIDIAKVVRDTLIGNRFPHRRTPGSAVWLVDQGQGAAGNAVRRI